MTQSTYLSVPAKRLSSDTVTLEALAGVVVDAAAIVQPGARAPYETDWRGLFAGQALAVVCPKTTEEVAQVVRVCAARQVAIVVDFHPELSR